MNTFNPQTIKIAEATIRAGAATIVYDIIPIYGVGFISIVGIGNGNFLYKPYGLIWKTKTDFFLNKSNLSYHKYQEAIVALIAFVNAGDIPASVVYVDMFCNKLEMTKNSINPQI